MSSFISSRRMRQSEEPFFGVNEDGDALFTAEFIAEFVVKPEQSTGRFAGVTGSWIMIANTEPFVPGSSDPIVYTWEGEGELTFPQGN